MQHDIHRTPTGSTEKSKSQTKTEQRQNSPPAPPLLLPPAPQLRQLPRLGSILLPLPRGALHRTLNHRRLRVAAAATRRRGGGGAGGRRGLLALPPLVPSRREGAQTR